MALSVVYLFSQLPWSYTGVAWLPSAEELFESCVLYLLVTMVLFFSTVDSYYVKVLCVSSVTHTCIVLVLYCCRVVTIQGTRRYDPFCHPAEATSVYSTLPILVLFVLSSRSSIIIPEFSLA